MLRDICRKENLLDLLENFILLTIVVVRQSRYWLVTASI